MVDLNSLFAEEYDSTKSYVTGNKCVFEKQWYQCKEATTGEFDKTKWEKKYLVDYICGGEYKIEPKPVAIGVISNKSSKNITIDISKRYLVSTALKYTDSSGTVRLTNFYVSDGIVQELFLSTSTYAACTLSGNTLTIENTNTSTSPSLYLGYSVLEI